MVNMFLCCFSMFKVIKNNLNPTWRTMVIKASKLGGTDSNKPIRVSRKFLFIITLANEMIWFCNMISNSVYFLENYFMPNIQVKNIKLSTHILSFKKKCKNG